MLFFNPKIQAFPTQKSKKIKLVRLLALSLGLVALIKAPSFDASRLNRMLLSNNLSEEELRIRKEDNGCISRENKLVYVHIPKTGGSTVERSELFTTEQEYANAGYRSPIGGHYRIDEMMHDSDSRGISDFVTATTIRHPCERFISAFRYVTGDKCNEGDTIAAEKLIGNRTLHDFVEYMEEEGWPHTMVHFMKMYPFLIHDDHMTFGVDNVLCQAQWEEGAQRLETAIGATSNRIRTLRRMEEEMVLSTMSHLEDDHKLANKHETCADLEPETRKALESHYAMDYCLFGFATLPKGGEDSCVGTGKDKNWFTVKYQECRRLLKMKMN
jgi:hypothetical protein|eukprot:scaffold10185_cov283-Chaetoceros_neogracile.AAC.7